MKNFVKTLRLLRLTLIEMRLKRIERKKTLLMLKAGESFNDLPQENVDKMNSALSDLQRLMSSFGCGGVSDDDK